MKDKYYYHITDAEHYSAILTEGIKPVNGDRRGAICDERSGIFLCKREDLQYWRILLNQPIVLRIEDVDIDETKLDSYSYSAYNEYVTKEPIAIDKIERVYMNKPPVKYMRKLCKQYITTISRGCELAARYYDDGEMWSEKDEWKEQLESFFRLWSSVKDNLDYGCLTKEEIREELKFWGDNGAYTFLDYYYDTGNRLYQQLLCYPEDEFTEQRKALHKWIKKTFTGCLRVNTGGWCG